MWTTAIRMPNEEVVGHTGTCGGGGKRRCSSRTLSTWQNPLEQPISELLSKPNQFFFVVEKFEANVSDATVKLEAVKRGEPGAAEDLFVLLYAELRRNAAVKLAHELPGQTLQPTALVHEAWLRLVGDQNPGISSRALFFHAASEAMRRILIDRARRKRTERHGGHYRRVDLDGFDPAAPNADEHLLAVHEVMDKLTSEHPVQAQVVKLRYFAGMTNEEVAEVMGISISTVKNYWTFSRAWLLNEIESG
jgi:RNA polymerase sigma factor (TIGR02999 family)